MNEPLFQVMGTTHGLCEWCNSKKSKKEKDLLVVKGPVSGEMCPEHLLILAKQQTKKE